MHIISCVCSPRIRQSAARSSLPRLLRKYTGVRPPLCFKIAPPWSGAPSGRNWHQGSLCRLLHSCAAISARNSFKGCVQASICCACELVHAWLETEQCNIAEEAVGDITSLKLEELVLSNARDIQMSRLSRRGCLTFSSSDIWRT